MRRAWSHPVGLAALGASLALLGLLDPGLQLLGLCGSLVSALAAWRGQRSGEGPLSLLLAVSSVAFTMVAAVGPEFRADAPGYYVYVRSIALDGDLDFANEWRTWGFAELPRTATGRRVNLYSIGPALVWAPFFAIAHLYVLLTHLAGVGRWAPDGYSTPYLNSLAAGSISAVVLGGYALARSMRGFLTMRQAAVIVAGAVLTSPVAYYTFVVPGMAHAVTFAAACTLVWAWFEAERAPSLRTWCVLGLSVGLLTLVRWQGLVLAVLPAALAVRQLRSRRAHPAWIAAAAAVSVLAFVPQMIVWKLLFGRWLTMPQGRDYVSWSAPHLIDVLFSAMRGFFNWTPVMFAGTAGLLWLAGTMPTFATAALAAVLATAWVNGGVRDWEASDAFGGRRFDIAVPLVAWGLAALSRALAAGLRQRPWAAIAALLGAFALWNAGFMRLYRSRGFLDAAPAEWRAGAQVHQLYVLLDGAAARLGPRPRARLYDVMVGEYFYYNVNLSGTIDVGAVDSRWLSGGWSPAERQADGPPFRWALHPRACVRIPLLEPLALRSFIRLRAPARIPEQAMRVVANGAVVANGSFGTEWTDLPFTIPAESLQRGLNNVCFEFERRRPHDGEGGIAAAVSVVQLP